MLLGWISVQILHMITSVLQAIHQSQHCLSLAVHTTEPLFLYASISTGDLSGSALCHCSHPRVPVWVFIHRFSPKHAVHLAVHRSITIKDSLLLKLLLYIHCMIITIILLRIQLGARVHSMHSCVDVYPSVNNSISYNP